MPTDQDFQELVRRVADLESRGVRLDDLPIAQLQRKLELTWQPEASELLQARSITPELIVPLPVVTVLPTAPKDGDECYYLADASAGVVWHLKYRAASASAYKWEYVGGPPRFDEITATETTVSTTYAALATAGPSITVPLAGDYLVEIGTRAYFTATNNASASMSYDIGGTGAGDGDRVDYYGAAVSGVATAAPHQVRARRKNALAASTALVAKYKVSGGTGTFQDRWMRVTPVRVG